MEIKPPSEHPAIRQVMMPRDTNGQGAIFGGVILSLIDLAAYVEALRQCDGHYATVAFDKIEFHMPVHVDDVVSLYTRTDRLGRTSVSVHVTVNVKRRGTDGELKVTEGEVVLVHLDESGAPLPFGQDGADSSSASSSGPR